MKKISLALLGLAAALALAGCGQTTPTASQVQLHQLTIGSATLQVEVATTAASQILGLSYRTSLAKNGGLLFSFPDYQVRTFWMKDMKFPLDIIWIYDGRVAGIDANLPPAGDQPSVSYNSPGPLNQALEVNGGYAGSNNIKVGDAVVLK